jgi:predicted ATPase
MLRPNFFVLTGASGSGKSSIIAALEARGFVCVREIGRQVVKNELAAGTGRTPWQDGEAFMELVLARSVEAFQSVTERTAPVFFDRGIPECIGAAVVAHVAPLAHRLQATRNFRYNRRVFYTPPWREIYATDAERRHTFEQGLEYHRHELASYVACGYELLEVPRAAVDDRVDFIVRHAT